LRTSFRNFGCLLGYRHHDFRGTGRLRRFRCARFSRGDLPLSPTVIDAGADLVLATART